MGVLAVIRFMEDLPADEQQDFAEKVEEGIHYYIKAHTKRGSGRLQESIKAHVYGKQIVVESGEPHAKALDRGTFGSRQIWSLINKVVPLKLDSGKVIFRKVTLRSVLAGRWRQRPQRGIDFVRGGVEIAKSSGSFRSRLTVIVQR